MPTPDLAPLPIRPASSVAALIVLGATILSAAEGSVRLPGNTMDLDEAIFRSNLIVSAEVVSPGHPRRIGGTTVFSGVFLKSLAVHKGDAQGLSSIPLSFVVPLTSSDQEVPLRAGNDFLVFIGRRDVIKAIPRTEEHLRNLTARLEHRQDFFADIDRHLPGCRLDLDAAVGDADIVEAASIVQHGFIQSAGSNRMMCGLILMPSEIYKGRGSAASREQTKDIMSLLFRDKSMPMRGYWMDISRDLVAPPTSVECIFIIRNKLVVKVLRKTEENVQAVRARVSGSE